MTEDTRRYLTLVEQVPPPMEDYKFPFPIKGTVYDYRLDFTVRKSLNDFQLLIFTATIFNQFLLFLNSD